VGVVTRADVWWADFGSPKGSAPAYRRPALVVSSDRFNLSRIPTVVVAAVTSNLRRGSDPGNVRIPAGSGGLPKESVISVTQLLTVDRSVLQEKVGTLDTAIMRRVDRGLRLVLNLI
jgi:mRNA interferase MazF